jgi:hypothetical protein
MRPCILIFPVALLLASHAGAQAQLAQSPSPVSPARVEVTAPEQPFLFLSNEAEWISGGYKLSNGWKMNVDPTSDGILAQIGKRRPVRLIAVSRDRYVSRDGNMSMEFNRGALGDEMLMSYVPDERTAQVIVVTATMAVANR